MDIPYRVLWLEGGGYIARYTMGSPIGGLRGPFPDLEFTSTGSHVFDIIAQIEDPDRQIWVNPPPGGPKGLEMTYIDENQLE